MSFGVSPNGVLFRVVILRETLTSLGWGQERPGLADKNA